VERGHSRPDQHGQRRAPLARKRRLSAARKFNLKRQGAEIIRALTPFEGHRMFERKRYMLDQIDPEIFAAIESENRRQEDYIELIASEN
jgi:hypothetical protein